MRGGGFELDLVGCSENDALEGQSGGVVGKIKREMANGEVGARRARRDTVHGTCSGKGSVDSGEDNNII